MSKKLMSIVCLSAALSMGLSFTAMAGTWFDRNKFKTICVRYI